VRHTVPFKGTKISHYIFIILYKMIYQKVKADVMATAENSKTHAKDSYPL
jgi:hypothetical protein